MKDFDGIVGPRMSNMHQRLVPAHLRGAAASLWARVATCGVPNAFSLPATVRVLVAGDHPSLRRGLKTVLEMDPTVRVVGEASDDCDTIKMARRLRPDVVLMDLDMRCCDGYEAIEEISNSGLARRIVALTIHDDTAVRAGALDAGVDVVLEKGVSGRRLVEVIRSVTAAPPARPASAVSQPSHTAP